MKERIADYLAICGAIFAIWSILKIVELCLK
jgi:hypothetical protein